MLAVEEAGASLLKAPPSSRLSAATARRLSFASFFFALAALAAVLAALVELILLGSFPESIKSASVSKSTNLRQQANNSSVDHMANICVRKASNL